MSYIADLHIHSRFSRACSPQLTIPNLAEAAKLKGISLLGTGDFLHPLWFAELKKDLKESGNGLYEHSGVKFVLTVEISSIYSHKGVVRRVHNIIMLPSLDAVAKFQQVLLSKGAILSSDGRPIVGISSKDLLGMCLEIDKKALFIPAHCWTPWFGVFGSKSGYDSLKDCFEDLIEYVYGVETGLSSDPAMNWRIKELDGKSIVSFSDAHSLSKLGREATIFSSDLNKGYEGLLGDLKDQRIESTIEFYPEEGKYHFDGHRSCNYSQGPEKTRQNGSVCPVCGKGLTIGVLYRVDQLATRTEEEAKSLKRPKYKTLVPLLEVIAETLDVGVSSLKVQNEYKKLTFALGPEIEILIKINLEEIARISGEKIAIAVGKAREGNLVIKPGFDGVYGVVKINDKVIELLNYG